MTRSREKASDLCSSTLCGSDENKLDHEMDSSPTHIVTPSADSFLSFTSASSSSSGSSASNERSQNKTPEEAFHLRSHKTPEQISHRRHRHADDSCSSASSWSAASAQTQTLSPELEIPSSPPLPPLLPAKMLAQPPPTLRRPSAPLPVQIDPFGAPPEAAMMSRETASSQSHRYRHAHLQASHDDLPAARTGVFARLRTAPSSSELKGTQDASSTTTAGKANGLFGEFSLRGNRQRRAAAAAATSTARPRKESDASSANGPETPTDYAFSRAGYFPGGEIADAWHSDFAEQVLAAERKEQEMITQALLAHRTAVDAGTAPTSKRKATGLRSMFSKSARNLHAELRKAQKQELEAAPMPVSILLKPDNSTRLRTAKSFELLATRTPPPPQRALPPPPIAKEKEEDARKDSLSSTSSTTLSRVPSLVTLSDRGRDSLASASSLSTLEDAPSDPPSLGPMGFRGSFGPAMEEALRVSTARNQDQDEVSRRRLCRERMLTQNMCVKKTRAVLRTPKASELNKARTRRPMTGRLASQLAMLPSLGASLDACLQSHARSSPPSPPRHRSHDELSALPADEYWALYCNGGMDLQTAPCLGLVGGGLTFPAPPTLPILRGADEAARAAAAVSVAEGVLVTATCAGNLQGILERVCGALKAQQARLELVLNESIAVVASVSQGQLGRRASSGFVSRSARAGSVAAHVVLADGLLCFGDVRSDWRFATQPTGGFYAGVAVRDADGHAVAVLAVTDDTPRDAGVTAGQRTLLARAAREAAAELVLARRVAMRNKLHRFDESIRDWAYSPPTSSSSNSSSSTPQALATPRMPTIPGSPNPAAPSHPEVQRVQKAVDGVARALGLDGVYVAQVTSDPQLQARCLVAAQRCAAKTSELDPALHLCTLAAGTRGLTWHGERAFDLLQDRGRNAAFTVRCCSHAVGTGWVLGVAAQNFNFDAPEVRLYLERFAALLAIVLDDNSPAVSPSLIQPGAQAIRVLQAASSPPPRAPLPLPPMSTATMEIEQDPRLPPGHILNGLSLSISPKHKTSVSSSASSHKSPPSTGNRPAASSPPPQQPLPLPPATSPTTRGRRSSSAASLPAVKTVALPVLQVTGPGAPARNGADRQQVREETDGETDEAELEKILDLDRVERWT